jgi:hypothetical protein
MEFRNQLSAINDCLYKYKESADFIAIVDPDDVIILPTDNHPNHVTYGDLFMDRLGGHLNAAAFVVPWRLSTANFSKIASSPYCVSINSPSPL